MNFRHKIAQTAKKSSADSDHGATTCTSHCFHGQNHLTKVMGRFFSLLLCFITLLGTSHAASESDQALGKLLEANLTEGEPLWLDGGAEKFFAVFDPDQTGQPKGGIILLHDAGSHPDKPEVIQPLRKKLPEQGWPTVALHLPALDTTADYIGKQAQINKRIDAAITYMRNKGLNNLALLGHGTGAMAATAYLANQNNDSIRAFVAVSLGVIEREDKAETIPALLEKISLPMLDIYGSQDLDHITSSAKARSLAAKISSDSSTSQKRIDAFKRSAMATSVTQNRSGYIAYRQIRIIGANHDFSGAEQILAKRITGWLERNAKGVAISSP